MARRGPGYLQRPFPSLKTKKKKEERRLLAAYRDFWALECILDGDSQFALPGTPVATPRWASCTACARRQLVFPFWAKGAKYEIGIYGGLPMPRRYGKPYSSSDKTATVDRITHGVAVLPFHDTGLCRVAIWGHHLLSEPHTYASVLSGASRRILNAGVDTDGAPGQMTIRSRPTKGGTVNYNVPFPPPTSRPVGIEESQALLRRRRSRMVGHLACLMMMMAEIAEGGNRSSSEPD
ncbi:hypothetical protein F5Y15DRAFT_58582 [Xylariaceae sp. FL0016]|nr:hypothetical protein F5Y15DRAFT_58582 [Xylariaceae sp. FL0016]